jgi:hypothetical protein
MFFGLSLDHVRVIGGIEQFRTHPRGTLKVVNRNPVSSRFAFGIPRGMEIETRYGGRKQINHMMAIKLRDGFTTNVETDSFSPSPSNREEGILDRYTSRLPEPP